MHLISAAGCLLSICSLPVLVQANVRIPLAKPTNDTTSLYLSTLSPWERTLSAVARLEQKYNLPRSRASLIEEKTRGVGKRQNGGGKVELTNVYADATYVGKIQVGTPAQEVTVILDTGSSDLWIADSGFAAGSSSSLRTSTTPFSIAYGSGSATGVLATDTVVLGGASSTQTFGLVSRTTSGLIFDPISGIFGFAWQALAQSKSQPWWLANVGKLSEPLFAFYLTRYSGSSKEVAGGEMTLGSTNSALYKGDINYVSLPSGTPTYWIVPLDAVLVGGSKVSLTANTRVAMDTGTTLIVGPQSDAAAIYAAIEGSRSVGNGQFIIPCNSNVNVAFTLGGTSYAMTSSDMTRGLYETGSSMCIGAISVSDLGSAPMTWIIGDAFLKNVYTVFRQEPAAVGFALLSDSVGGSPSVASGSSSPSTSSSAAASSASQSSASTQSSSSSASASASSPSSSASTSASTSASGQLSFSSAISTGASQSASSQASISSASASVTTTVQEGTGGIVTRMDPAPTQGGEASPASATQSSNTSAAQMQVVVGGSWKGWMGVSIGTLAGLFVLA